MLKILPSARYQVQDNDSHILFVENDYEVMRSKLMDIKNSRPDGNIDGYLVIDSKTCQFDYAWRVVMQMNDLRIGN